jgi:hypothetical protein
VTTIESSNNDTNTSNQAITVYFEPVNDVVVIDNTTPLEFSTLEDTSFTITQATATAASLTAVIVKLALVLTLLPCPSETL